MKEVHWIVVEVHWNLLEIQGYLAMNFIETYLVGFHFLSGKFTWNLVRIRTEIYLVRFQQNKRKVQDICRSIIIIQKNILITLAQSPSVNELQPTEMKRMCLSAISITDIRQTGPISVGRNRWLRDSSDSASRWSFIFAQLCPATD